MALLNFEEQFASAVKYGDKRQTIRAQRKSPIQVGELISLYTGVRTPHCERLGIVLCKQVRDIVIGAGSLGDAILIDGREIDIAERAELARADGFNCWTGLINFLRETYGLPFYGQIYNW